MKIESDRQSRPSFFSLKPLNAVAVLLQRLWASPAICCWAHIALLYFAPATCSTWERISLLGHKTLALNSWKRLDKKHVDTTVASTYPTSNGPPPHVDIPVLLQQSKDWGGGQACRIFNNSCVDQETILVFDQAHLAQGIIYGNRVETRIS